MAQLKYDKEKRMLWVKDGDESFPIFTLANLNGNNTRLTSEGFLEVKNSTTDSWDTVTDSDGQPISLMGVPGKDGETPVVELSEEGMLKVNSKTIKVIGPKGDKGDKGDTGEQGPKGEPGSKGDDGKDGKDGQDGADGKVLYTWIKYADDANGSGLSDSPTSENGQPKAYIGFAYNKDSPTESNIASYYKWTLIKGADGTDGIPGANGADGVSYYTWIKYSDNLPTSNTDMYEAPGPNTQYIGIATNKTEQSESSDYTQYNWSKFKGDQGVAGEKGEKGDKGEDLTYITAFPESPDYGDRVIWNGKPIVSDLVPSGITETGETYEYQNSDSVPESIMKTSYVLKLGTDSTNMGDGYTTFDTRFTKPVYDLISRKSKLVQQDKICINLKKNYKSLLKNLPSVYLLWQEVLQKQESRLTLEQKRLRQFINSLSFSEENSTIPIYCSCYTTSTNLTDDTGYWIPISELNIAKHAYPLS